LFNYHTGTGSYRDNLIARERMNNIEVIENHGGIVVLSDRSFHHQVKTGLFLLIYWLRCEFPSG
jgi:hypothetical protein